MGRYIRGRLKGWIEIEGQFLLSASRHTGPERVKVIRIDIGVIVYGDGVHGVHGDDNYINLEASLVSCLPSAPFFTKLFKLLAPKEPSIVCESF